jgi:ribosomal protein S18 acetylase RimI-like enzyme
MPITVHTHTSLENNDFRSQLERLYDISPEFSDGQDALTQLEHSLAQDTLLYTAEFNTKLIGAIWCRQQDQHSILEYVVVHPANRGRGVAERLVSEVCRMQEAQGILSFKPGCGAIQRCLMSLEKL